jgi:hypothetical protein
MLPALHRKIVHEKFELVTRKKSEKTHKRICLSELDKPG